MGVIDDDVGAMLGGADGGRPADAGRCAGDEDGLAFKQLHGIGLPCFKDFGSQANDNPPLQGEVAGAKRPTEGCPALDGATPLHHFVVPLPLQGRNIAVLATATN